MDDYSFKDASAAATTDGRFCDGFVVYKFVCCQVGSKSSTGKSDGDVATAHASWKLKSSNFARVHLALIRRTQIATATPTANATASVIRQSVEGLSKFTWSDAFALDPS